MPVTAKNRFRDAGASGGGGSAAAISPSDTDDIGTLCAKAVYVSVAGNIKVTGADMETGTSVTIPVPTGWFDLMRIKRLWATGTTATVTHAIY